MLNRTILTTVVIALSASALAPSVARAEGCNEAQEGEKKKDGKNFHIEVRNGVKVYVIDEKITVCGKVPRPSVFYVTTPKTINYEWESLKQAFLPLIMASVKKAPF